jgi:multiple sugar transport system permease protein
MSAYASAEARQAQKYYRTSRFSLKQRDSLFGYLFVSPMLVGFVLTVLAPLVMVFYYSFQARNMLTQTWSFVGLDNYAKLLGGDVIFSQVLGNTLVFTAGLVPLNIILALVLAVLLHKLIHGSTLFRVLFFAPVVTSAAAWAIVWRFVLQGENGTLNSILATVGIDGPNWLRDPNWAMFSVIFTRVLKNVGLNMIILLAALQSIPREYEEAAQVDGATVWARFTNITIPLLGPTLLLTTILTVVGSLKVFDHIILMTNSGPANATMVLVNYVYFQAFRVFDTGYASALAVILFVLALVATIAQWQLRKRFIYNEV